jgi:hypothetical protein
MYICMGGCADLVTPHHLKTLTKQNIKHKINDVTCVECQHMRTHSPHNQMVLLLKD